jgi:hypothetical protein
VKGAPAVLKAVLVVVCVFFQLFVLFHAGVQDGDTHAGAGIPRRPHRRGVDRLKRFGHIGERAARQVGQAQAEQVHLRLFAAVVPRGEKAHLDLLEILGRLQRVAHVQDCVDILVVAAECVDLKGVPDPGGGLVDLQLGLAQALLLEHDAQVDQSRQVGRVDRRRKGVGLKGVRGDGAQRDVVDVLLAAVVGHSLVQVKTGRFGFAARYRRIDSAGQLQVDAVHLRLFAPVVGRNKQAHLHLGPVLRCGQDLA